MANPNVPQQNPSHLRFKKAFHQSAVETHAQGAKLKKTAPQRIEALKKAKASGGTEAHLHQDTLLQRVMYPAHDKRKESPQYAKVHKQLVHEKNLPCLVCGVTAKTLTDPKLNPYGATALETHHHLIEWALANAISAEKFNRTLRPHLKDRHPDKAIYQKDMNEQQIRDWVDHDPDNLWVICDVHHRHKFVGIHAITYPIWCPQDLVSYDITGGGDDKTGNGRSAPATPSNKRKPPRPGAGSPRAGR